MDETENSSPRARLGRIGGWKTVLLGIGVIGLVVGVAWFLDYRANGRFIESTNNAYIKADFVTVSSKVAGYVATVPVSDNQTVPKGALLAVIDPRDYQAATQEAQSQVSAAEAGLNTATGATAESKANVAQAEAQLSAARSALEHANAEVRRYGPLVQTGAESRERLAALRLERDRAAASLRVQEAAVIGSRRALATQTSRIGEAKASRQAAIARLARARNDLQAAEVRASVSGVVGDKAVRVGQFIQPATPLMTIVPIESLYVEANFKETQVALMRVGQPATISVDALDGAKLKGRVVSFAPATGAQFSLIPPENATGNFTKIVQRVPVRIRIGAGPEARKVLRPGLSVEVSVNTKGAAASFEKIQRETERSGSTAK